MLYAQVTVDDYAQVTVDELKGQQSFRFESTGVSSSKEMRKREKEMKRAKATAKIHNGEKTCHEMIKTEMFSFTRDTGIAKVVS